MRRVRFTEFLKTFPGFPFYRAGDDCGGRTVAPFVRLDRSGDPSCFYIDANGLPEFQMIAHVREDNTVSFCITKLPPTNGGAPHLVVV